MTQVQMSVDYMDELYSYKIIIEEFGMWWRLVSVPISEEAKDKIHKVPDIFAVFWPARKGKPVFIGMGPSALFKKAVLETIKKMKLT
jgi:hypothetical protein